MCGIVGFLGDPSNKADDIFTDLLQLDVLRGKDSCGIASVTKKGAVVFKGKMSPQELISDVRYGNLVNRVFAYCLIGHNRYATTGAISDNNAHPFQKGEITMVHNGTLHSKWRLDSSQAFETDSEAICHSINKIGIEETWKLIDGPTLLVWWDRNTRTVNMISNGKRPLTYVYLKDRKGVVWASEEDMLLCAIRRNKAEIESNEGKPLFGLHIDTLYTFKFNKKDKKVELELKKLEPFVTPLHVWNIKDSNWNDSTGVWSTLGQAEKDAYFNLGKVSYTGVSFPETKDKPPPKLILVPNQSPNSQLKVSSTLSLNKDLKRFKFKKPSKEHFHKQYKVCCTCNESLLNEYDSCSVIDKEHAMCTDCAWTASKYGISL